MISTIFIFFCLSLQAATFSSDFIFGVANAPGQVEDQLDDIWMTWGRSGKIRSWKQTLFPEKKLEFWSKPEIEIKLAKELGVSSMRIGIDWGRVMPVRDQFDPLAIEGYRKMIRAIRAKNMKVMLTLWHHSVPKWVQESDGWKNDANKKSFVNFSLRMVDEFHQDVEWWLTFNEANVFVTMAYGIGIWPPGESSTASLFALGPFRGSAIKALDLMANAHNEIYQKAHAKYPAIKMGYAHNMAYYNGKSFLDRLKASFVSDLMNWRFPEKTRGNIDFYGFNYYGAEWLKGTQVDIDPEEEYSEAGRAIFVHGIYDIIKEVSEKFPKLPIIITENGIADAYDKIRPAYHLEHLMAIHRAISEGIPVQGYYVWSLTDNLEWSDGYCPKFGLVGVDRASMNRLPRESYYVLQKVFKSFEISAQLRDEAWTKVTQEQGKLRPFCRANDGVTAFDEPVLRPYVKKDWRFR